MVTFVVETVTGAGKVGQRGEINCKNVRVVNLSVILTNSVFCVKRNEQKVKMIASLIT